MDLGIRGRTALVTGASAGIGAAVALALAREGVRLAVAARRSAGLDSVVAEAKRIGAPDAAAFSLDLSDPDSIALALERLARDFGEPDIVVLNGGGPKPGRFSEISLNDWDGAYQILVRGMLEILDTVVPGMRARKWGRIVALTSSSVKQPIDTLVLSNAFRTALVSALRTLAVEVAADGVTVNCIATGRIETERLRLLYGSDERQLQQAAREIPIGHIATPEEFAPATVFLCSEPARYVTGQTISVDGGLVRGLFG
jgi:3-oxoacyl-[acyl-carrier protein] reductase